MPKIPHCKNCDQSIFLSQAKYSYKCKPKQIYCKNCSFSKCGQCNHTRQQLKQYCNSCFDLALKDCLLIREDKHGITKKICIKCLRHYYSKDHNKKQIIINTYLKLKKTDLYNFLKNYCYQCDKELHSQLQFQKHDIQQILPLKNFLCQKCEQKKQIKLNNQHEKSNYQKQHKFYNKKTQYIEKPANKQLICILCNFKIYDHDYKDIGQGNCICQYCVRRSQYTQEYNEKMKIRQKQQEIRKQKQRKLQQQRRLQKQRRQQQHRKRMQQLQKQQYFQCSICSIYKQKCELIYEGLYICQLCKKQQEHSFKNIQKIKEKQQSPIKQSIKQLHKQQLEQNNQPQIIQNKQQKIKYNYLSDQSQVILQPIQDPLDQLQKYCRKSSKKQASYQQSSSQIQIQKQLQNIDNKIKKYEATNQMQTDDKMYIEINGMNMGKNQQNKYGYCDHVHYYSPYKVIENRLYTNSDNNNDNTTNYKIPQSPQISDLSTDINYNNNIYPLKLQQNSIKVNKNQFLKELQHIQLPYPEKLINQNEYQKIIQNISLQYPKIDDNDLVTCKGCHLQLQPQYVFWHDDQYRYNQNQEQMPLYCRQCFAPMMNRFFNQIKRQKQFQQKYSRQIAAVKPKQNVIDNQYPNHQPYTGPIKSKINYIPKQQAEKVKNDKYRNQHQLQSSKITTTNNRFSERLLQKQKRSGNVMLESMDIKNKSNLYQDLRNKLPYDRQDLRNKLPYTRQDLINKLPYAHQDLINKPSQYKPQKPQQSHQSQRTYKQHYHNISTSNTQNSDKKTQSSYYNKHQKTDNNINNIDKYCRKTQTNLQTSSHRHHTYKKQESTKYKLESSYLKSQQPLTQSTIKKLQQQQDYFNRCPLCFGILYTKKYKRNGQVICLDCFIT